MPSAIAPVQTQQFPLDANRVELLSRLVDGLDAAALHWLSGYASGLATARGAAPGVPDTEPERDATPVATIVYGSQTGNGRHIAEGLATRLGNQGLNVRLLRTGEYPVRELAREQRLFIVMSTHGDGDPPDDARAFTEFLLGRRAPRLEQLEFSVLSLGDSSYPKYCEIGRRIDERLVELGARRLIDRVDCDIDFETPSADWAERAYGIVERARPASNPARITPLRPVAVSWSRERPFAAALLANQRITIGEGVRDVRHIELSLAGSGLRYEPGDALGVVAGNPDRTVEAVLQAARLDGDSQVERNGRQRDLAGWLSDGLEITRVTKPMIAAVAGRSGSAELARLLQPGHETALREFMIRSQLVDLLEQYPADWDAAALTAALRPLVPRLYSIASSQREVEDEVHLTVARIDSGVEAPARPGAASHFLASLGDEARVPVYIEANPRFRLPADATRDIIMIGPGTGVAPYRGFMQDRAAVGARGRSWLLFGARRFAQDFLYQLEWQAALKRGTLDRLDLAFSRGGGARSYVQQRIVEAGAELYAWIDSGAYLYVCGDAQRMAPDVHAALTTVLERHGGLSAERAIERLDALSAESRYLRDVY